MTKPEVNMTDAEQLLYHLTKMVEKVDFRKPGTEKSIGKIVRAVTNYNAEVIDRGNSKLHPMNVLFTVEGHCVFIPRAETGQQMQGSGKVDNVPERSMVQPPRGQVEGDFEHIEVSEGRTTEEGQEDKEAGGSDGVTGAPV